MSEFPQLITEREAAKLLGWTVQALQKRRFEGKEPSYIKLGTKSVRYDMADLKEFIKKCRVAPREAA